MGFPATGMAQRTRSATRNRWEEWDKGARAIIDEAIAERHPILLADALTARLAVWQSMLFFQRMEAAGNNRVWEVSEGLIRSLMSEAERAMEVYRLAGNLEGETRAKLLLADLFDTAGQDQAAKKLAEGAIVIARAMNYPRLESHASEYIEGRTSFQQFRSSLARRRAEDEDVHIANEPDEGVRSVAQFVLDSLELPLDRLPVLVREATSIRTIARERISWCRHLNLIQDLRHTLNPATCYLTDPNRACECEKHRFRSSIEHTDADVVISRLYAN
jgi:hypothetical protein